MPCLRGQHRKVTGGGAFGDHPVGGGAEVAVVALGFDQGGVGERFEVGEGAGDQAREPVQVDEQPLVLVVADLGVQLGDRRAEQASQCVGEQPKKQQGPLKRSGHLAPSGVAGGDRRRGAIQQQKQLADPALGGDTLRDLQAGQGAWVEDIAVRPTPIIERSEHAQADKHS